MEKSCCMVSSYCPLPPTLICAECASFLSDNLNIKDRKYVFQRERLCAKRCKLVNKAEKMSHYKNNKYGLARGLPQNMNLNNRICCTGGDVLSDIFVVSCPEICSLTGVYHAKLLLISASLLLPQLSGSP